MKAISSLVDVAFFVALGLLGWHGVLKEAAVLSLLALYAQGRFNVAMQKQQSNQMQTFDRAAGSGGGPSMRPPSGGGGGAARYQAMLDAVPVRADAYPTPQAPPGQGPTRPAMQVPPETPRPKRRDEYREAVSSSPLVGLWRMIVGHPTTLALVVVVGVVSVLQGCGVIQ